MKRIYKYELEITDYQVIEMPVYPEFLSVQFQNEKLCVWVIVDPEAALTEQVFKIVGMGHEFDPFCLRYIDTVQQCDGQLIWHVFQVLAPRCFKHKE